MGMDIRTITVTFDRTVTNDVTYIDGARGDSATAEGANVVLARPHGTTTPAFDEVGGGFRGH